TPTPATSATAFPSATLFRSDRFQITLPVGFFAWIALFIFGTIFLGEALNFYERYWWWDLLLHAGSAMGFGLVGFLFAFMLFQGRSEEHTPQLQSRENLVCRL